MIASQERNPRWVPLWERRAHKPRFDGWRRLRHATLSADDAAGFGSDFRTQMASIGPQKAQMTA
jgi:hypothetical protein